MLPKPVAKGLGGQRAGKGAQQWPSALPGLFAAGFCEACLYLGSFLAICLSGLPFLVDFFGLLVHDWARNLEKRVLPVEAPGIIEIQV